MLRLYKPAGGVQQYARKIIRQIAGSALPPFHAQLGDQGVVILGVLHEAPRLPALLQLQHRQHVCAEVLALWPQHHL